MREVDTQLAARKVVIELRPAARQWLAQRGYDETMGARPMARLIQQEVKRVLADEVLFGKLKDGGKGTVDVVDDALTFDYGPIKTPPVPVPA